MRVTAYVKNFTDEEYRLYDLDLGLLGFIESLDDTPHVRSLATVVWV